jgi:hypothetical protein
MSVKDVKFKFTNYDPDQTEKEIVEHERGTRIHIVMNAILFFIGCYCVGLAISNQHNGIFLLAGALLLGSVVVVIYKLYKLGRYLASLKAQYHIAISAQTLVSIEIDTEHNQLSLVTLINDEQTTYKYGIAIFKKDNIDGFEIDLENSVLYVPNSFDLN